MKTDDTIILGSKSPRRQEILRRAGYDFKVIKLDVEESYPVDTPVHQVPVYLALKKASAYAPKPGEVLVTCDTVVILDGEVLEKPANFDEAFGMLKRLNGKEHLVVSGLCVKRTTSIKSIADSTVVKFAELSDGEIAQYIRQFRPYDKAGGYGVQEWMGMVGVEYIRGSFYNVMGLPIHKLYRELS